MQSFWKRQLPLAVAVSLIAGSWPLPASAAAASPSPEAALARAAAAARVSAPAQAAAPAPVALPETGEVIVKFRPESVTDAMSMARSAAAAAVTSQGGAIVQQDQQARMLVKLPAAATDAAALIEDLRSMPDVAYVENNGVMQAFGDPPNDPRYSELWGLTRMNASAAWTPAIVDGPQVVVAVVDSGVDRSHPDLAGRVLPGFSAISGNADVTDGAGHGTHVSGTIAAVYNNATGISGITGAANVRILPVKVLDADGRGSNYTVARGIDWAADHGAQVINLSLGGGHSNAVQDSIVRAERLGVVVVAAAGNESSDTAFVSPADVPGVVTVAALGQDGTPARFSNYGDQVEVIAPGTNILSTVPGGGYEAWNGTSMATPHVAGLAALIKAAHPAFSRWDIQACLYASVDQTVLPAGYGYGVPQADRAVACDPAALDRKYALKVEGPDPDQSEIAPTLWFDVKGGGGRISVKDSHGKERGSAQVTGEGMVKITPNLTGLASGRNQLTATFTDRSGAVVTQLSTINIGTPSGLGLRVSSSRWNPAKGSLKITTSLKGTSIAFAMAVFDTVGEGNLVRLLTPDWQTYTGPLSWDGKDDHGHRLPDGQYEVLILLRDYDVWDLTDFTMRVAPTPTAPKLTVAAPAVNVPTVNITGKVTPNFGVEVQVKAPGTTAFDSLGLLTTAGQDGTFTTPVGLLKGEGTYEIQVRGVDRQDLDNVSSWTSSAKVQFDATAPVVQLTSHTPVDAVIMTPQKRLSLAGTTEPRAQVTALIGIPDASGASRSATANEKGLWQMDVTMPDGADSFSLSAIDPAGNHSEAGRYSVVIDPDAPALTPAVLVLHAGDADLSATPNSKGTYAFATKSAPQYVLAGVMSERIARIEPSNRKFVASKDGNSFSVDLTPGLVSGTNTFSLDIYDFAGNKTKLSAVVVVDDKQPTVTVTQKDMLLAPKRDDQGAPLPVPATFTVTGNEPLSAVQTVWPAGELPAGVSVTATPGTDPRKWTISMVFPAADSAWSFQFVGVDLAGNVGVPDVKARRQVTVDATLPELNVTNDTTAIIYSTTTSLTVSGTVADTGSGLKSLTVNKRTVRPNKETGSFSTKLTLAEGKLTTIPVVAVDLAGNTHTEMIRVVAKSKIGVLKVSTPRLATDRLLTISGRTDAAILLPDQHTVGLVPVTVVITDSLKSAQSFTAVVDPDDGTYTLLVDTSSWAAGKYSVAVTAGAPDDFEGIKSSTVTTSFTIR